MAPTAEKIMAVAGTFNALAGELEGKIDLPDPRVQAALLMAATEIAMHTDTRDMGILIGPPVSRSDVAGGDFTLERDRNGQQIVTPHEQPMRFDAEGTLLPDGYDEDDPYARE